MAGQRETLKSYRDLIVWQRAMDLSDLAYDITENFPRAEIFGLRAQIRDAVTSIPSNIAEGYGRRHLGDYLRHLSIAFASLCEVETRVLLALRRKFITREQLQPLWNLAQEEGKMLRALINSLETKIERSPATNRILRTATPTKNTSRKPPALDPDP